MFNLLSICGEIGARLVFAWISLLACVGSANSKFSELDLAFVCNVSGKRSCLRIKGCCVIAGFSTLV